MKGLIALVVWLIPVVLTAQKTFTEKEFLAVVKRYHPIVKQTTLGIGIAAAEVTAARGAFDPAIVYGSDRKQFEGINYYDNSVAELRIPTWYGIEAYAGEEHVKGSKLNPEETKGTVTYYGFAIPLLQNLLMDKRRAALKQAKVYRQLTEVEQQAAVNDLLYNALTAYWNWWEQYQQSLLLQEAIANADKRFGFVRTAYRLGERPAIDTLEAMTQVQTLQLRQSEVAMNLAKTAFVLNTFLWKENNEQYDLPGDAVPQFTLPVEPLLPDEIVLNLGNHPELVQYDFKLNALNIDRQLKWQGFLPKLYAKYAQTGRNTSDAIAMPWFDKNYKFGLSFSMPLRLSEARGNYRMARLKIAQTTTAKAYKQVELYNKVKQYQMEWQQTKRQLSVQQQLLNNIRALQQGEETRFANGESSLFMVNSREIKTIETRQKLLELQAKNQKAIAAVKWAAGRLE